MILLAGDDGVFAIEGASVTALPTFDRSRRMADVAVDGPRGRSRRGRRSPPPSPWGGRRASGRASGNCARNAEPHGR
ncbi:hypothetical protein AB5I41_12730 [Sphingomonas sp. MMS24-JH45]